MPYSSNFLQVTFGGQFGSATPPGVEQWVSGIKIHAPSGGNYSLTERTAFAADLAAAGTAFHQSAIGSGTGTYLRRITVALIGTDGKYVTGGLQLTAEYIYGTPVTGTGAPVHSLSAACVLSLRTAVARGRSSHGRMFWPAVGLPLTPNNMIISSTNTTAIAAAGKAFLDAINAKATTRFGEGAFTIVASKLGAGSAAYVTKVLVGQKLDAQERREKSIPENYVTATLVTPPTMPGGFPVTAGFDALSPFEIARSE